MAQYRNNGELFTERRSIIDVIWKSLGKGDHGSRVFRRGRRLGRFSKQRLSRWAFIIASMLSISLTVFGLKMFLQGEARGLIVLYGTNM